MCRSLEKNVVQWFGSLWGRKLTGLNGGSGEIFVQVWFWRGAKKWGTNLSEKNVQSDLFKKGRVVLEPVGDGLAQVFSFMLQL